MLKQLVAMAAPVAGIVMAGGASAQCVTSPVSVQGIWKADDDSIYVMRQRGTRVRWTGTSGDGGKTFTNRFDGFYRAGRLFGKWLDVPPGRARSRGTVTLQLQAGGLMKITATGGFGGSRWTRVCGDVNRRPVRN